jgi:hypothetical protein
VSLSLDAALSRLDCGQSTNFPLTYWTPWTGAGSMPSARGRETHDAAVKLPPFWPACWLCSGGVYTTAEPVVLPALGAGWIGALGQGPTPSLHGDQGVLAVREPEDLVLDGRVETRLAMREPFDSLRSLRAFDMKMARHERVEWRRRESNPISSVFLTW